MNNVPHPDACLILPNATDIMDQLRKTNQNQEVLSPDVYGKQDFPRQPNVTGFQERWRYFGEHWKNGLWINM